MDKEREPVEEDAQGDQIDKTGVREAPSWQELMKFMTEQNRQTNESLNKINEKFDKIDENFRKQEEKFDKTNEENKETSKQMN